MQSGILNPAPAIVADFVDRTHGLPPAPTVALAAHEEAGRFGATASSLESLVERDPALTTQVLQCGNDARRVADLVASLGMEGAGDLCLLVGAYSWLNADLPVYGLTSGWFMTHSLAAALASRAVAEHAGLDGAAAFAAGLLHDLGKVAISMGATGAGELVNGPEDERRIVGFDHGALGGELARRWNLPPSLVGAITHHHQPCERLDDAVHVGDALAHLMVGEPSLTLDPQALARMNLTLESMLSLVESLKPELERHLRLLEVCA